MASRGRDSYNQQIQSMINGSNYLSRDNTGEMVTTGSVLKELTTGKSNWTLLAGVSLIVTGAISLASTSSFVSASPDDIVIAADIQQTRRLTNDQRVRAARSAVPQNNDFYAQLQQLSAIDSDETQKIEAEEEIDEVVDDTANATPPPIGSNLQEKIEQIQKSQRTVKTINYVQIGAIVAGVGMVLAAIVSSWYSAKSRANLERDVRIGLSNAL